MDEPSKSEHSDSSHTQEVRYVHKPPPLWPPPKFVWAILLFFVVILGLVVLRLWIALR